jgi:hypothetical protein
MDELVRYQCEETSCQEAWARFNVALAVKALRETAANISAACTGEMPQLETPGAFVSCIGGNWTSAFDRSMEWGK